MLLRVEVGLGGFEAVAVAWGRCEQLVRSQLEAWVELG